MVSDTGIVVLVSDIDVERCTVDIGKTVINA